jgi:uncharacterized delta-60 repeat protein
MAFSLGIGHAAAQDGSLDLTFNSNDPGRGYGDGGWNMYAAAQQSDGKVLIGGNFTGFDSITCGRIVRILENNGIDPTFVTGSGANGDVNGIALQPDGRIVAVGNFTSFNGVTRNRIVRLNTSGGVDLTFDPGVGATATARAVAVQSDGKILVAGDFFSFAGGGPVRLGRLNPDGSRDLSFNVGGFGANGGQVSSIALQPDGKILIAGAFTTYNGVSRNGIARVNTDGSLDTTFDPGSGCWSWASTVLVQSDGRIVIGGYFLSYNGVPRPYLARLNTDGSLDNGFLANNAPNYYVYSLVQQADGKLVVGGHFTAIGNVQRPYVARLNIDGSLDTSFAPPPGTPTVVDKVLLTPNGDILVGGSFGSLQSSTRDRFVRLNPDGSLDTGFALGSGASGTVADIELHNDGRITLVGDLTSVNNTIQMGIARLLPDGSVDPLFNSGSGANGNVSRCLVLSDDRTIIVGAFTSYNGAVANRIALVNADGSLNTGFASGVGTGADGNIRAIARQPDGKILIGGAFNTFNGSAPGKFRRLNADGTLDVSFPNGSGINGEVHDIAIGPGGKIIVVGNFTLVNGVSRNRVARLNADGSLDTTFDPGTGAPAGDYVSSCSLQPDGKLVITGAFEQFNGTPREQIARLNADGSLDAAFNPTVSGISWDTHLQPDGRILIVGDFWAVNGTPQTRVARLLPDGSLDATFGIGSGANAVVNAIAMQNNGQLLIGGGFRLFNGIGRNRIARINNTSGAGIRVMLEGPYTSGLMNDALRTLPSFPLTEPFTAMGYGNAAYNAGATIAANVLTTTGNNAIVDWVLVEMRPASAPGIIAAARAALLQRDGDVVALDGTGPITFPGLANGSYCLAVRPRNHLPVMLTTTAPVNYTGNALAVDFTLAGTQVYDSDARKNVGGVQVLAAGDVTFNGTISYTGDANDRDPILTRVGGVNPTATLGGYWREDVNMDGVVKYTGAANDRDLVLLSVGGVVPTNTRVAPLP